MVLDLAGRRVELDRTEALRLRAAAAAQAGSSSVARDLSVLLARAVTHGQVLALRRGEAHTLSRLAFGLGLDELAQRLTDTDA